MTFTSQQIETITQSVLRELRSRGIAIADAGSSNSERPVANGSVAGSNRVAGVGMNDKVITEDSLAAASAAGRTVSICPGAVITPSGHDYIRRNGVSITSDSSTAASTGGGLLIIIGTSSAAASAAGSAKWRSINAGCENDAGFKARKHLPKPVVCCGGEPAVTACLLNRDTNIRAAVIGPNTDLSRLSNSMNPQVICLDSVGWTFAALVRLFRQLAGPTSAVPTKWKELP